MSITWPDVLGTLLAGRSLTRNEAAGAMERIMEGDATPAQLGAFLAGMRAKGETVEEITGLVETMRRFALAVDVDGPLVDTCGTGGDRLGSINVSTIASLVVAGAGIKVAKHGNRAASSRCGSADLLEELGVKIDLGPEGVQACVRDAGMGFCFAPVFHPSMRHAGPTRRELGVPTVFNFLGPLTNPARATRQAIGVSDPQMAPKMVEVLRALGSEHVVAFHGSDGLDEITITGPTALWELKEGEISAGEVDPAALGIAAASPDELRGGSVTDNAKVALEVLSGSPGAARDLVLANAAAGLLVGGAAPTLGDAVPIAAETIDSGRARRVLDRLVEVSNRV
jgi:anthranilate phosphoribosyltransferase